MDKGQAWIAVLQELAKQHGIENAYFYTEAITAAVGGWHSTSYNYALRSGLPREQIVAAYALIFG